MTTSNSNDQVGKLKGKKSYMFIIFAYSRPGAGSGETSGIGSMKRLAVNVAKKLYVAGDVEGRCNSHITRAPTIRPNE